MISKKEMLNPVLEASPSFMPIWKKFLEEWKDEDEMPLYLTLGDLARHIGALIESEKIESEKSSEIQQIFSVVEAWHLEGDSYVKEAATIGLLEDLQNTKVVGEGIPKKVEPYLLPESKASWNKINKFWNTDGHRYS